MFKAVAREGAAEPDTNLEVQMYGPMVSPDIRLATQRGAAKAYGTGIVRGAQVKALTYITRHALTDLEKLEAEEAAAISRDPMSGGRRQRGLVDEWQAGARDIIANMARDFLLG